jgi:hypothetical protein
MLTDDEIKAALPTEPAAPSPDGLFAIAAAIRAQFADPNGIYANRPDLKAAAELDIAALMLRAGVTEPVATPQSLAERQHSAAFSFSANPAAATLAEQEAILADAAASPARKAAAQRFVDASKAAWGAYQAAKERVAPKSTTP